jgi:hypothetical protein
MIRFGIALLAVVAVGLAGFYWNEARGEVVILCSNFGPGTTEESVRRQLDTGHFLRYSSESLAAGSRITVDSIYNFSIYRCIIELDEAGKVREARVE